MGKTTRGEADENQLRNDLIFVSDEEWDEIWRRNQFLCVGLCQRSPELRILFVARATNYPRLIFAALRQRSLAVLRQARQEAKTQQLSDYPQVFVARVPKPAFDAWPLTRKVNQWVARRHLKKEAARLGFKKYLLWLNRHDAHHMAGQMGERASIYDITDDWTEFGSPRERQLTIEQDGDLCRRADLTIVCSQSLYDTRKDRSRAILHLPNGVQLEHYQNLAQHAAIAPSYPGPVFGYTGTLHPERVDASLLEALAREYPGGSVVLVGPNHFDTATCERLTKLSNVHFIGAVPYSQIPRYMAAFDVCIVPHLETPFTQSLNPLKLWEYLACGKPVASTNVAGFQDYAQLCHIGSGTDGFLQACRAALGETEDRERATQRQAAATGHSWDARLDTLLTALEKWNS